MHAQHPDIAKRWDKEYPNQKNLSARKAKLSINNKLKGAFGQMDPDTNKVQINLKKHYKKGKLDKAELASTIKHELLHVKHPKMTEKDVYKKSAKTKIPPKEQYQLLAQLRRKKLDQETTTLKRKFKMDPNEKVEPGTFITKMNTQKAESPRNVAIMGMV